MLFASVAILLISCYQLCSCRDTRWELAEQGVKESCDEEKEKEFPTRAFVIDTFYVTLCVLVFHADLKALLLGRICKGPQATRHHASRISTQFRGFKS